MSERGDHADYVWLKRTWVEALHFQQMRRFGGLHGIRDDGAVDSALARPHQLLAYGNSTDCDLAVLAGAYAFGLTRNHGYVDGNKRTGFLAAAVFLRLNGQRLEAPEPEVVRVFRSVAAGEMDEEALVTWFREHLTE